MPVVIPPASHPLPAESNPYTDFLPVIAATDAYLTAMKHDVAALGPARDDILRVRNHLDILLRTIDNMVIDEAGHQRAKFDSGVEVKQGVKRSEWQSEELAKKLFVEGLREGGLDEAWTRLKACLPLTSSLGWRVTELRKLNVRVPDWCREDEAALTVQWPKGES